MNPLDRHGKIMLQFSGGKDSLACLYLCRPYWDKIVVVWANPGNPYPETVAQMRAVEKLVPHFLEVEGEQPEWIKHHGYPVDLLPVFNTERGRMYGTKGTLLQSTLDCCAHNMLQPLAEAVEILGVTLVVRGQKNFDKLKGPLRNGDIVGSVTYHYPLEKWTDAHVLLYLEEQGVELPPQYARGVNTSIDCVNCTGYAEHNRVRWEQMKDTHPDLWPELSTRLQEVRTALAGAAAHYW